ncbi:hypothetical protein Tco_0127757 [Tanacetum coccineum]
MIVHTDHSALRHLFKKQDAKPCLIRWILLLQEFDIEIKDRKVDDNFPGETLMEMNIEDEPWFADFANYLVSTGRQSSKKLILKFAYAKHVKRQEIFQNVMSVQNTNWFYIPTSVYNGKNCHLPFEIEHHAYWALDNCNPDLIAAGEKIMFQLHELDELRHQAYENSRLYKARTKVWHDRKLKMRKEFKYKNKMHTRASNSELVEPLPEPERILNRRRHRRNRRVPFDQRNNPPKNLRIVYPPILNINHFRHFLNTLENLFPIDDEPMWAADRVVA